jgi:hypothetical protein
MESHFGVSQRITRSYYNGCWHGIAIAALLQPFAIDERAIVVRRLSLLTIAYCISNKSSPIIRKCQAAFDSKLGSCDGAAPEV